MTWITSQHISENWLSREEMTAYFREKTGNCAWFFLSGTEYGSSGGAGEGGEEFEGGGERGHSLLHFIAF